MISDGAVRTSYRARSRRPEGAGRDGYDLYEEDDRYLLAIEIPGFDREEIDVAWGDGVLNVVAEHEDEERGRRRSYRRRFRIPKTVDDVEITARYVNGVLEVRLPVPEGTTQGREIEVRGQHRRHRLQGYRSSTAFGLLPNDSRSEGPCA